MTNQLIFTFNVLTACMHPGFAPLKQTITSTHNLLRMPAHICPPDYNLCLFSLSCFIVCEHCLFALWLGRRLLPLSSRQEEIVQSGSSCIPPSLRRLPQDADESVMDSHLALMFVLLLFPSVSLFGRTPVEVIELAGATSSLCARLSSRIGADDCTVTH